MSGPIEVPSAELEEIAANTHRPILLPPNRAGWAYVLVAPGRKYMAWVDAP